MIKVETTQRLNSAAGTRRRDRNSGYAFAEFLDVGETTAPPPPATVASIGTLLAVQEVNDQTHQRRRAVARGTDLLDRLDGLRHDLLLGTIDSAGLATMARLLRSARADAGDPELQEIIAEIELRAEVEIAKLSMARAG